MIRRYCDACGQEIQRSYTAERLVGEKRFRMSEKPGGTKVNVEVHVAVNGTWNAGDICRDCVIDTVMALDTRPQMAEEPV